MLGQPVLVCSTPDSMRANRAEVTVAVVKADSTAARPAVIFGHLDIQVATLFLVFVLGSTVLVCASSPPVMSTMNSDGASSESRSSNCPGMVGL